MAEAKPVFSEDIQSLREELYTEKELMFCSLNDYAENRGVDVQTVVDSFQDNVKNILDSFTVSKETVDIAKSQFDMIANKLVDATVQIREKIGDTDFEPIRDKIDNFVTKVKEKMGLLKEKYNTCEE